MPGTWPAPAATWKVHRRLAEEVADPPPPGHRPLNLAAATRPPGTFQGMVGPAKPNGATVGVIQHPDAGTSTYGPMSRDLGHAVPPDRELVRLSRSTIPLLVPGGCRNIEHGCTLRAVGGSRRRVRPDTDFFLPDRPEPGALIDDFIRGAEQIHLSIDLDVLPAAVVPAVSAGRADSNSRSWSRFSIGS